jgi:hypothetical protein
MFGRLVGNRPKGMSFGNEYGLYNDLEETTVILEPFKESARPNISNLNSNVLAPAPLSLLKPAVPCNVVCDVLDEPSPIACRSFTAPKSFAKIALICIDGLRIVQDGSGEDAEYHITLNVDGRPISAWRRYEDFRELGGSFEEFCDGGLLLRRTAHLQKSLASWRMVQKHRPWLLRDVSVQFLREESRLLESFLTNILHEFPTIDLLMEFVCCTK